jgi:hypothetical protein
VRRLARVQSTGRKGRGHSRGRRIGRRSSGLRLRDVSPIIDATITAAVRIRIPIPFRMNLPSKYRAVAKLWGVQVAAGFNRENALAMYARAMKGLSDMIGERDDPLLVHSRGTSTFYQVQIGADTRREADDLCSHMRRAGGACLVKRNKVEGLQISRAKGRIARRAHAHWRRIPPATHDARIRASVF